MLGVEDNEVLTRVGPGTAMGGLFRRFWLPALLSEELPAPDCEPVRLRLLGEDLVAFRDTDGTVGVLDAYCAHRNAPLFFGRNEESGLRCVYHGWKFDVNGNCVDIPNTPEGETYKTKFQILHYPVIEGAGMVWVFMGPQDRVPPPPGFAWFGLPDSHVYVTKYWVDCNYAQTLENEFDVGHSQFLHSSLRTEGWAHQHSAARAMTMNYDFYDTPYGCVRGTSQDGGKISLSHHFMMPAFSTAGSTGVAGTNPVNIKIPVDDTRTVFFRMVWSENPLQPEVLQEYREGNRQFPLQIPGTFLALSHRGNDYLVDREKQRKVNYTGMDPYPVQDLAMVEDQRGPIADRSRERLVASDRYLIHIRRRLINAAKALAQGEEPQEPWRPEAFAVIRRTMVVSPEEYGIESRAAAPAISTEG